MSIATTCPNCKALFRLADDMAGEKVKCQKCQHLFVVPKPDEKTMAPATSVVKPPIDMELGPMPPAPPQVTAAPPEEDEVLVGRVEPDEEPERPRRRRSTPPPKTKRHDDAPTARRPRRTSSGSGSGTTLVIVLLLGGGLFGCLGCAGLASWVVYANNKPVQVAKKDKGDLKAGAINATLGGNGSFRHNGQITQFDPRNSRGWPHKLYGVHLEANRTYQIDMMAQFDTYLFLRDDANFILDEDDDGGDGLNSQIIFRPLRSGFYYIDATSLGGERVGPYTLVIQRL